MRISKRGWAWAMMVVVAGVGAEHAPLACPAGTEARESTDPDAGRQQFCVDPKTGMKEGPVVQWHDNGKLAIEGSHLNDKIHGKSRYYAPSGELMIEAEFEHGQQVKGRLTAAGLRQMQGNLETRATMHSMLVQVSIPEDWTLRYDVTDVAAEMPPELKTEKAEESRVMACEIFRSPFDNDFVVQLRHVDGAGKVLREKKLLRKDCADAQ
jgi:hypothetical protein